MIELNINNQLDKRIHKPKKLRYIKESKIKYDNAEKLAEDLEIKDNERYFVFISGNFIFGDLIEAICVKNDFFIKKMTVSTLSLSELNVDSFKNLLVDKYVNNLSLIVSDYFYSHERKNIIPYIYKELDIDNRFQLSVARIHAKICLFETYCNKKIVIHGSANLRSSDNIEQIDIEENKDLYDYINEFYSKIIKEYKTINKKVGGKKLWQVVGKEEEVGEDKQQN